MKRPKEAILKDAVLTSKPIYIQQLCLLTGLKPKQVKASVDNVRNQIATKAKEQGKTFENLVNELYKNNKL